MVWHKTNPAPKLRRAGFLNSCELIVCVWNKGHTWNFGRQNEMHNFIETPICMGHEHVKNPKHPTQKPVKVLEHLLKLGSKEGDLVFDPFMGVGSTGVAALKMQRRFLGIEKEAEYVLAAVPRLEAASGRSAVLLPQSESVRAPELELIKEWRSRHASFRPLPNSGEPHNCGAPPELALGKAFLSKHQGRHKKSPAIIAGPRLCRDARRDRSFCELNFGAVHAVLDDRERIVERGDAFAGDLL